jgi:glycosyltransferase involved in cell wall biosynthesis
MNGSRPHRIAFVSDAVHPFNQGGKETRLHEITRGLARDGFDVHVYTMKWWDGGPTIAVDGVTFHAIGRLRPLYRHNRRSTTQAVMFGLATLRLLTERFDVVEVDQIPLFPLFGARLVCVVRRKPLYATWHEVWGSEYWRQYMGALGRVGAATERLALRMPDEIISCSQHTTERLRRHGGGRLRVRTIPLGVDFDRVRTVPPSSTTSDVMYAGRLLSHKNVDVLLEAIAAARRRGRELRCVIVGEGPERPGLEARAERLGVRGSVRFMDFCADHDDVLSLMKATKVFVLPSEREGFGVVVLEANACGAPVVTVRHPDNGAQHLVVDGENGFVSELAPDALADAVLRCVDDPLLFDTAALTRRWDRDRTWSTAGRVGLVLAPDPVGAESRSSRLRTA